MLAGDRSVIDAWIRASYPGILRFLRHLTGGGADAEDLAQITFLNAQRSLGQFRFESSLTTWLHRIAYREYTNWLRQRKSVPLGEFTERVHPMGRSDDAIVLASAISDLSSELRETFVLRMVQGLAVRDCAHVLGIPEGTVKSRTHLAREQLRKKLAGTWEVGNESCTEQGRNEAI